MQKTKTAEPYREDVRRLLEAGGHFKHVMALVLDSKKNYQEGVIRAITSREGDLAIKGFVDKSELHIVRGDLNSLEIGERLFIKNEQEVIKNLTPEGFECIGLEDPDIWHDEDAHLTHLYFTIPIMPSDKSKIRIHLGHAVGHDLHSLEMTEPVLLDSYYASAKEVSIAPLNSKGVRLNLIESRDRKSDGTHSSVVKIAKAHDMGKPWEYGDTAFHPNGHSISWIAEDASPGPLFSKNFIDVGKNKLLGILNGRDANKKVGTEVRRGTYSVGLCIYDFELGKIDWVSNEPFIRDSEARIITFASQCIETTPGQAILFAHVDDSFVRRYDLNASAIKSLLPTC